MEQLIEELSKTFREKRMEIQTLRNTIDELELAVRDEQVLAKDYLRMKDQLTQLKVKVEQEKRFAEGLESAREIVLNHVLKREES